MPSVTALRAIDSRFTRYVSVGVASLAIDIGVLTFSYRVLGFALWLATSLGFWLSFVVNFLLSKHFTFRVRHSTGRQLGRYTCLVIVNYLATLALVTGAQALGISYLIGKIAAVGGLTVVTYFLYRRWVFVG